MKVIVIAPALILTPGSGAILRLTAEEVRERKAYMTPADPRLTTEQGFFKCTAETHFKKGSIVEFLGDVPKMYTSSVAAVDADGKQVPLPPPTHPARAVHTGAAGKASDAPHPISGNQPVKEVVTRATLAQLDTMTKAELLDFAEAHQVAIDSDWNKTEIIGHLKKKVKAAA